MKITYKKLLPAHAERYREVRLESLKLYPQHFGAKYEEQANLPELRFEGFVKQQDANNFVIGALQDKSLIGICAFVSGNNYHLGQTGTLIQMYVKKEFSGQKIGLGLVNALLTEVSKASNLNSVILEVNPDNDKAIHVYKQAGFITFSNNTSVAEDKSGSGQLMIFHSVRSV